MATIKPGNGEALSAIPTMILTDKELFATSHLIHGKMYGLEVYGTREEINVLKASLKGGENFIVRPHRNDARPHNFRLEHPSGRKNEFIFHEETFDDVVHLFAIHTLLQPDFGLIESHEKEQREKGVLSSWRPAHLAPIIFAPRDEINDRIWDTMQRYNTPLLAEWKDVLINKLETEDFITNVNVFYFNYRNDVNGNEMVAKRLEFSETKLERTVTEMIQSYELPFALDAMHDSSTFDSVSSLTGYIERFAGPLANSVQDHVDVLFDPATTEHHPSIRELNLFANKNGLTGMFAPQADTVMATAKTISDQKFSFLSGEMGVGKTLMGSVLPFTHASMRGKTGYRAIVLSPKSLLAKWEREIKARVPGVKVFQISTYEDLIHLHGQPKRPDGPEYYILSQNAFKAGYPMEIVAEHRRGAETTAQAIQRLGGENKIKSAYKIQYWPNRGAHCIFMHQTSKHICIDCGHSHPSSYFHANGNVDRAKLSASNKCCEKCGGSLWAAKKLPYNSKLRKVSPAWYINKHFKRGFFEYLLVDEAHEYKSGNTEIGRALGQLINHCSYKVMMTGTLFGGNATDLFYLLARLNPDKLKREGITYKNEAKFHNFYGVTEQVLTSHTLTGKTSVKTARRPGINPTLYPMHLMPNSVFLEIADLGFALPPYAESARFVDLDDTMRDIYEDMFRHAAAFHQRIKSNSHVAEMFPNYNALQLIHQINSWLDRPYRYSSIGLHDIHGEYHSFYTVPESLDVQNHKLAQLEEDIDEELQNGRKLLVYVKDVDGNRPELGMDIHLYNELTERGYNVGILRSGGMSPYGVKYPAPENREKWIKDMQARHGWDVLITNPSLVKVGLDLYEYPTIVFYQYGMSSFEYMQAARRSWRIGQTKDVKVITYAYAYTPQQNYLEMLASKIDAALTIQGKLTEDGLRNLSESTSDLSKLAKSIMEGDALSDVETVHERFNRINKMAQMGAEHDIDLYKHYEQNPIEGGMDTLEKIKSGEYDPFADAIEAEFVETVETVEVVEAVVPAEEPVIIEDVVNEASESTVAVLEREEQPPMVEPDIPAELYDPEEMFKVKAVKVKRKSTKQVVELEQFELQF
ncbi:SNF2-related protein [Rhodococcus sp. IEGM1300]